MLTTIFMFGLIVGFGLGRFIPGAAVSQADYMAAIAKTGGSQGAVVNPGAGAQQPTLQPNPTNNYDSIAKSTDATGHYSVGNKDAKVKVVEFSDFQCPFCYRYFTATFPRILADYVTTNKIYYTYYNFPLNIHPQAPKAAEASLCAGEQNKYWEYHDLLFENQNLWSGNSNSDQIFSTLAKTLNLDQGKFNQCVNSGKYTATVTKDTSIGEGKEISGTPTVFVNGQKIVGAQDYYVFKKAIEDELAK